MLKFLFISLLISTFSTSCGLIDKFKTPDQVTDSKDSDTVTDTENKTEEKNTEKTKEEVAIESNADDLFNKSMNETNPTAVAGTDAPENIAIEQKPAEAVVAKNESNNDELTAISPKPSQIKETKPVQVQEALPEIKAEITQTSAEESNEAGKTKVYKVKKGDTLMIIAFNLYGDISKWKELKQINGNSTLRTNMELKYKAPAKTFVWNPSGIPYMIKNGDTLGIISNSVYQTPKKWKSIWENNKPLIKNPNIIYAGFTLYYKNDGLANYVQPKHLQKKIVTNAIEKNELSVADSISQNIEEVKVEKALSEIDKIQKNEIDLTKEIQSSTMRDTAFELKENQKEEMRIDNIQDEAVVK